MIISIALAKDIKKIMIFLRENWKENHILSNNIKLFKFYYLNKKKLNFIIAIEKNKIVGTMGFILNSKYSKKIKKKYDIVWPNVLFADKKYPGLGLQIYNFFIKKFHKMNSGLINFNKKAEIFYKLFGYKILKMNHYFLPNPNKKKKIIIIKQRIKNKMEIFKTDHIFINLNNINLIKNFNFNFKNNEYVINKYLKNPFYNYKCLLFFLKKKKVLLIFRKIDVKKSSILKIVDFIGDPKDFEKISPYFINMLNKFNSEYIDFIVSSNFNLNLNKLNFYKKKSGDIVPSYFEPLIMKNFQHKCGFINNSKKNLYIFKGDGDSERPNLI